MCVWRGIEQGRVSARGDLLGCVVCCSSLHILHSSFLLVLYWMVLANSWSDLWGVFFSIHVSNVVLVTQLFVRTYACDYFATLVCLPSSSASTTTKSFAPPTGVVFLQTLSLSLSYSLFESSYPHVFFRSIVRRLPCLFLIVIAFSTACSKSARQLENCHRRRRAGNAKGWLSIEYPNIFIYIDIYQDDSCSHIPNVVIVML
jgi:hypothetical protein